MKVYRSRAPLRLGLAGGGTDVSPYCDQFGGYVLNATIDLYVYCSIEELNTDAVELRSIDLDIEEHHDLTTTYPLDQGLQLHRAAYNCIVERFNQGKPLPPHRLTTMSDVPSGSGLGGSSTVIVAIIRAYMEWLKLPLGEYDLAYLAYEIERIQLGQSGGRQDQYAASFGGINFMEFYDNERVVVNPLRVRNRILHEFELSLMLYSTTVSRTSHTILKNQIERISKQNEIALEATHQLKKEALMYKEFLLKGNLRDIASILQRSWSAKKRLADKITNPEIDRIFSKVMDSGALGGKISGAGGGGFLIFIVDPLKKREIENALKGERGKFVPFHFTQEGAEAWKVQD